VQSLFFFFSAICSVTIVYTFPVLQDEASRYFLKENFPYVRLCVFVSAFLSIFAIFQYKHRKRQQLIASFSRLMITVAFFLIVFFHSKDKFFGSGMILLIIPFLSLIAANFFISKDEKLVSSSDRIR
jgi:membrane-associated HD superfamily phosphohydrolase